MGKTVKGVVTNSPSISKMAVNESELKDETMPNPIVQGGIGEIGLVRINPIDIPKYLLMHPALPRGIEIKGNRLIKLIDRNLKDNMKINSSGKEEAKVAFDYCKKILKDSGGPLFLREMAMGAHRFGTSFSVLQTNKGENAVLRFEHQHEIFFGPARYPEDVKALTGWGDIPLKSRQSLAGKMKINPLTKKIAAYTQLTKKYPSRVEDNFKTQADEYVNTRTHPQLKSTMNTQLTPVGDEFSEKQVIQLFFDNMGDEPLGISLVQPLQLTLDYILKMEKAGAQTMVNFGFNKWVAETPFKTKAKMEEFAGSLANIQIQSVVVLPENIKLRNIAPGTTEFDKIHPIYLRQIAMRLGIPMPLLLQEGTSTNKATLDSQKEDMHEDFVADELQIERMVNDGFFKACKIKWPDMEFEEIELIVPEFFFKQPPESLDAETDRNLKFSLTVRNYTGAAEQATNAGLKQEVIDLIGQKVSAIIQKSMGLDVTDEGEVNGQHPTPKK
jgi:hypothetical protein